MTELKEMEKPAELKNLLNQLEKMYVDLLAEKEKLTTELNDKTQYAVETDNKYKLLLRKYNELEKKWKELQGLLGEKLK